MVWVKGYIRHLTSSFACRVQLTTCLNSAERAEVLSQSCMPPYVATMGSRDDTKSAFRFVVAAQDSSTYDTCKGQQPVRGPNHYSPSHTRAKPKQQPRPAEKGHQCRLGFRSLGRHLGAWFSLLCLMSIRIGEAKVPGPSWSLGAINPSGVLNKVPDLVDLPRGIYALSETALTKPGELKIRRELRYHDGSMSVVWSSGALQVDLSAFHWRQATGVAFFSSFPCRPIVAGWTRQGLRLPSFVWMANGSLGE